MNIKHLAVAVAFSLGALTASSSWAANYFEYSGTPGVTTGVDRPGSGIAIQEHFNENTGRGSYSVQNNTGSYSLLGFGVSNPFSFPYVGNYFSGFGCETPIGQSQICYEAVHLTAFNWDTEEVSVGSETTFGDVFGDFSDNVEPGESVINYYRADDGALQPGASSSDFFLFDAALVASIGLGVLGPNIGGNTVFFNQLAVTDPNTAVVPIPAALPLMLGGLGLLGLVARRRKSKTPTAAA